MPMLCRFESIEIFAGPLWDAAAVCWRSRLIKFEPLSLGFRITREASSASLLISMYERAAVHVLYMYFCTAVWMLYMYLHVSTCIFHLRTAGTAACIYYMLSMLRVPHDLVLLPFMPVPIEWLVLFIKCQCLVVAKSLLFVPSSTLFEYIGVH